MNKTEKIYSQCGGEAEKDLIVEPETEPSRLEKLRRQLKKFNDQEFNVLIEMKAAEQLREWLKQPESKRPEKINALLIKERDEKVEMIMKKRDYEKFREVTLRRFILDLVSHKYSMYCSTCNKGTAFKVSTEDVAKMFKGLGMTIPCDTPECGVYKIDLEFLFSCLTLPIYVPQYEKNNVSPKK